MDAFVEYVVAEVNDDWNEMRRGGNLIPGKHYPTHCSLVGSVFGVAPKLTFDLLYPRCCHLDERVLHDIFVAVVFVFVDMFVDVVDVEVVDEVVVEVVDEVVVDVVDVVDEVVVEVVVEVVDTEVRHPLDCRRIVLNLSLGLSHGFF